MGIPVDFEGVNRRYMPPAGRDDIRPLHAYTNGNCVVTAWMFTPEEIEEISRTGKVFVSVMSGENFYPTLVGSSEMVREMLVDYGGTFPKQKEAA